MESLNSLMSLPTGLLVALVVLVVVQLALQILALVNLVRLPSSRIALGGRKWLWALIIVFGEIVGAIVYFAAGRLPAPASEAVASSTFMGAGQAADVLYGPKVHPSDRNDAEGQKSGSEESNVSDGSDGTGMGELP